MHSATHTHSHARKRQAAGQNRARLQLRYRAQTRSNLIRVAQVHSCEGRTIKQSCIWKGNLTKPNSPLSVQKTRGEFVHCVSLLARRHSSGAFVRCGGQTSDRKIKGAKSGSSQGSSESSSALSEIPAADCHRRRPIVRKERERERQTETRQAEIDRDRQEEGPVICDLIIGVTMQL